MVAHGGFVESIAPGHCVCVVVSMHRGESCPSWDEHLGAGHLMHQLLVPEQWCRAWEIGDTVCGNKCVGRIVSHTWTLFNGDHLELETWLATYAPNPPTMAVVTAAPVAPMMMTVAAGTPTQAYADELHVLLNMTVMTTSLTQPQQQFQHQQHWGGSNCEE